MAPRVLVSDKLSETAVQIFRDRARGRAWRDLKARRPRLRSHGLFQLAAVRLQVYRREVARGAGGCQQHQRKGIEQPNVFHSVVTIQAHRRFPTSSVMAAV